MYEICKAPLCDENEQPYVQLPRKEYRWLMEQAAGNPNVKFGVPPALSFDDVLILRGAEGFPRSQTMN
jgi:hypothetical protein